MRKFLVTLCSVALLFGSVQLPTSMEVYAAQTGDISMEDGDIITNPYPELNEEETSYEEETTKQSGSITLKKQPKDLRIAVGYIGTMSVQATSSSALTYKWFVSKNNGATWLPTTNKGCNTDTISLKMGNSANGIKLRCEISAADGSFIISDPATFILDSSVVPECSVRITKNPEDGVAPAFATSGQRAVFSVEATGNIDRYCWQVSKDGGNTWNATTAQGWNEPTLYCKLSADVDGRLVRCAVYDVNGSIAYSNTARLVMIQNSINVKSVPSGTYYATSGQQFNVSVDATAEGISYLWYVSKNGGTTWNPTTVTGYNTNKISLKMNSSFSGSYVRCVVSDKYGNKYTTPAARCVMTDLAITKQPTNVSAAVGASFDVSLTASGTHNQYQWYVSKDNGATWTGTTVTGYNTNKITMKMSTTLSGRMFRCVIKDTVTGYTVTSNSITVTAK